MTSFEVFCEGFVVINLKECFISHTWQLFMAAAYLFSSCNFILVTKMSFSIDGNTINYLPQSGKQYTLCSLYRLNQPSWKIHGVT